MEGGSGSDGKDPKVHLLLLRQKMKMRKSQEVVETSLPVLSETVPPAASRHTRIPLSPKADREWLLEKTNARLKKSVSFDNMDFLMNDSDEYLPTASMGRAEKGREVSAGVSEQTRQISNGRAEPEEEESVKSPPTKPTGYAAQFKFKKRAPPPAKDSPSHDSRNIGETDPEEGVGSTPPQAASSGYRNMKGRRGAPLAVSTEEPSPPVEKPMTLGDDGTPLVSPRRRRYASIYQKKLQKYGAGAGAGAGAGTGGGRGGGLLAEAAWNASNANGELDGDAEESPPPPRAATDGRATAKSVMSVHSNASATSIHSTQSDSAIFFGRSNARANKGRRRVTTTAEMLDLDLAPFSDPYSGLEDVKMEITYVTTTDDWAIKTEAITKVRRLVVFHPDVIMPVMQFVMDNLAEAVQSARTGVARVAMKCVEDIAVQTQSNMVLQFVETLLKRASETNEFISSQAVSVLDRMVEVIDGYAMLRCLEKAAKLKHPGMRQQCASMVLACVRAAEAGENTRQLVRTQRDAEHLATVVLGFMEDGTSSVRQCGKDVAVLIARMESTDARMVIKEVIKQCPVRFKEKLHQILGVSAAEAEGLMLSPMPKAKTRVGTNHSRTASTESGDIFRNLSPMSLSESDPSPPGRPRRGENGPSPMRNSRSMLPSDLAVRQSLARQPHPHFTPTKS